MGGEAASRGGDFRHRKATTPRDHSRLPSPPHWIRHLIQKIGVPEVHRGLSGHCVCHSPSRLERQPHGAPHVWTLPQAHPKQQGGAGSCAPWPAGCRMK